MAQVHKLESQPLELKCSADKYFDVYNNNVSQLTKLCPETYKRIQVLQGDGKSVGTVRLWTYVQEDTPNALVVVKERVKAVDEKNRSITFSALEGDLMNYYDSFEFKLSATPKGGSGSGSEGGCLVKWCVEYEKKNESVPPPNAIMDLMGKVAKRLDAHFLKA